MSNHRKVAIFWDYENCSPPLNSQGHAIVNGIRRIAHVFGYVTSFKAYFDMSSQSSHKSVGFRSDLQSSGVSIIDCPHNGKKEVVDKMILVDMIAFAVDNPSPATIILIAGDRDYAYAVSTLRLRQYSVVLIVPPAPNIPQSLESQASVVVDWNFAILGKPSGDAIQPSSTWTPKKVASTIPETPARPRFESVASRTRSATHSTQNVPDIQDATQDPFARTFTSLARNQNSAESGLPPTAGSSNCNFPPSPPPAVTFNVNLKNAPLPSSSTDEFDASADSPLWTTVDVTNSPSDSPPTPAHSVITMSPSSSAALSPSTPSSLALTDPDSDVSTSNVDIDPQQATSVISDNTDNPSGCQVPPIESMEDKIRRNTPLKFLPLINRLLLARSKREMKSSRSTIAIDLVQYDKSVYLRAGVTRFAQYTALAEQASLVQLGGREGDAWITLHPDLFRQDIDSGTPQSSSTPLTVHDNNSPTPQADISYTRAPTPSSSTMPQPSTASPGSTGPPTLNPNAEPFIAVVPIPLCFRPLITCLAKFHREGVPKPVRSAVGQGLGLAAYSQAGTSSLKEYLAQAVYAGVVECGGSGASAWARLHPDVLNGKRSY
ncbi:NYN domain-containing protein [Suillus placidus]|uniref:NYN domain-containing protein n=1 Tax=Suillus placidus TaxID=48579 RepID=A0A9P6ZYL2_9AGAM|nr:NYN domain-containing protein [Suillus placidus]